MLIYSLPVEFFFSYIRKWIIVHANSGDVES